MTNTPPQRQYPGSANPSGNPASLRPGLGPRQPVKGPQNLLRRMLPNTLARRLALAILLIAALPVLLVSLLTYSRSRSLLRQQTFDVMQSVAEAQAGRLTAEVETAQLLLSRALADPQAAIAIQNLLNTSDPTATDFLNARRQLFDLLAQASQQTAYYNQLLLLLPDGTIHASTKSSWQGLRLELPDETSSATKLPDLLDLDTPFSRAYYGLSPLYPITSNSADPGASDVGSFVFVTALPVRDARGQRAGTIIGISESPSLRAIIEKASFFADKQYIMISASASQDVVLIGINPYPGSLNKLIPLEPSSEQQNSLLAPFIEGRTSLVGELRSFEERPVIAAYTWLPSLGLAWVVEIAQAQVYAQLNALLTFILVLTGVLILLILVFTWQGASRMLRPLETLTASVQAFAGGEFKQAWRRVPVQSDDEIGALSNAFNQMAGQLSQYTQNLQQQIAQRSADVRVLAELAHIAASSSSLEELLNQTIDILQLNFAFEYSAIYLAETAPASNNQNPGSTSTSGKGAAGASSIPVVVAHAAGATPAAQALARKNTGQRQWLYPSALTGQVALTHTPLTQELQATDIGAAQADVRSDLMPGARFEAALPLLSGDQLFGILHLQTSRPGDLPIDVLTDLQVLAGSIAAAIQNYRLLQNAQSSLDESNRLYQASYQVVRADSPAAVFNACLAALSQTSYQAAILIPDSSLTSDYVSQLTETGPSAATSQSSVSFHIQFTRTPTSLTAANLAMLNTPLHGLMIQPGRSQGDMATAQQGLSEGLPALPPGSAAPLHQPVIITDIPQALRRRREQGAAAIDGQPLPPIPMLSWARQAGFASIAIYPLLRATRQTETRQPEQDARQPAGPGLTSTVTTWEIAAFVAVGAPSRSAGSAASETQQTLPLTSTSLQPVANLVELANASFERLAALQNIQRNLTEFQTISAIGRAVSIETDLQSLYRVIHEQILATFGHVSFLIALYESVSNTIEIPYMIDMDGQPLQIAPFPLGNGLTSIIIRTRQPLRLVKDTAEQTRRLGAITTGKSAKSWLGVPMLLANQPIGALVVQDTEQELRFDENDERLLTTIASQIVVYIRNARLLDDTRLQAERQRQLFEITSKIRRSVDMASILQTTASEIGAALGAHRAHVQIGAAPPPAASQDTGTPANENGDSHA